MSARDNAREILGVWEVAGRSSVDRPQSARDLVQRLCAEAGAEVIHQEPRVTNLMFRETQLPDGSYWQVPIVVHVHNFGVELWSTFAADLPPERLVDSLSFATTFVREYGLAVSESEGTTLFHLKGWTDSLELIHSLVLRIKLADRAQELSQALKAKN